jgi:hypothetical protein
MATLLCKEQDGIRPINDLIAKMKYPVITFLSFLTLFSCHRARDTEDPYLLATSYCHCINDRVKNAEDA